MDVLCNFLVSNRAVSSPVISERTIPVILSLRLFAPPNVLSLREVDAAGDFTRCRH
jgi:hypothetical protein